MTKLIPYKLDHETIYRRKNPYYNRTFVQKKHKREHFIVENALLGKLNLNVSFIPKVFTCYMFHNMLKNEKEENIY